MRLKLVENKEMEETQVTIEFQEKDESVKRLVTFVEHMEKQENGLWGSNDGVIFPLKIEDVLYMEAMERKTFCYTAEGVYELEEKLYELEEKYRELDFMRISKSNIVNMQRIRTLKPDFGGKILVTMDNGEKLYISRQYAPIMKEKLGWGGKRG
jgi:DNA-binding LytR/AlgR family response regulator